MPLFLFYDKHMTWTSSPRIQAILDELELKTAFDIMRYLPRTYESLSVTPITLLVDKQRLVLSGRIATQPRTFRHGRFTSVTFKFLSSDNQTLSIIAFNRPYLSRWVQLGLTYRLIGTYDAQRKMVNLVSLLKDEGQLPALKPIYSLPNGLDQHYFVKLVDKATQSLQGTVIPSKLPESFRQERAYPPLLEAYMTLHRPSTLEAIQHVSEAIKAEEAYTFFSQLYAQKKTYAHELKRASNTIAYGKVVDQIERLPFQLTKDQLFVLDEIVHDLNKQHIMMRLLQGDVGSGKTVIAALTLYANYVRGQQGALMVPTDTLAKQHVKTLRSLLGPTVSIALLTGSLSTTERKAVKEGLTDTSIDIVVGTHALYSEDITYADLGCIIIDEQHRFGVQQRQRLQQKGRAVDTLMMSATPIPRSLALTLYADMDVSTLTSFPFEQRRVKTTIVEEGDALIDYQIQLALSEARRVYILAPRIDDDPESDRQSVEALFDHYAQKYPRLVGLLHGKLSDQEKEVTLQRFEQGLTPMVVSTTVIEVGVDIPLANTMIIHDANTFGLATLHQLRGRIGRDGTEGLCLLVVDDKRIDGLERLRILETSHDGFYIAEQDLTLRGPGEMIGLRQAGLPSFHVLNLVNDQPLIQQIKQLFGVD